MMNIYFLSRFGYIDYDGYDAKVIVAENENEAREMANIHVGDEGKIWTSSRLVSCEKIDMSASYVVLESFNAG